ncbi:hypothetical protein EVJ58_g3545 [Rhodofomes roseus]|uniref:Uncharacterized protein n=1 Tax=Rhodofomes roseus TaxID=34475 RepID=A0A4Y9YN72_9APHY|nr:hypothetical protein EVJ58_g3545 [Rhodofomes roseus]
MSLPTTSNRNGDDKHTDPGDSCFMPLTGTFVVIQLDIDTTIKRFKLDTCTVTDEIKNLRPKKYLGSIQTVTELPMPFKPSHKVAINFVGKGICAEDYDDCVTPGMCTPIEPTSGHPSVTREAVQPSPGFPFGDCYFYSFVSATVRVPTKPYLRRHMVSLDGRGVAMLATNKSDDVQKYIALKKERGFPLEPYEEDEDDSSYDEDGVMEKKQVEHRSECCTDSESMISASSASYDDVTPFDEDELAAIFLRGDEEFEDPEADETPVSVNAWVDLREIEEVVDPSGFLEEVAHLRRVIREAKARSADKYTSVPEADVQMSDEITPIGGKNHHNATSPWVDRTDRADLNQLECMDKTEHTMQSDESQTHVDSTADDAGQKGTPPPVRRIRAVQRLKAMSRWCKRSYIARGLRSVRDKIGKTLRAVTRGLCLPRRRQKSY